MTEKEIEESFRKALCSDTYKDFQINKMLFEGKSSKVFFNKIIKRIKLAYNGRIVGDSFMQGYDFGNQRINYVNSDKYFKNAFEDLVSSNDIHRVSTNSFCDLALNEGVIWTTKNEADNEIIETIISDYKINDLFEELIKLLDYSGSCLLKVAHYNNKVSFDYCSVNNYFPVTSEFNKRETIGFVEYTCIERKNETDVFLVHLHTEKSTESFFADIDFKEAKIKPIDSQEVYMRKYGLSVSDMISFHDSWQVFDISVNKGCNPYGTSNYSDASKKMVESWIAIDTTEDQSVDTVLRPKHIVSEDFVSMSKGDNPTPQINMWNDFMFSLSGGSEKPYFEQIKNEFDFEGSKSAKEQKEKLAMRSLKTNETALGTSDKGYNSISGKMIDMTVPVQHASRLYEKVALGVSGAIKQLAKYYNINLEVNFKQGNSLTLTEKEKIENAGAEIDNKLKSNKEAIADYRNIDMIEAEKKYKEITEEEGNVFNDEDLTI